MTQENKNFLIYMCILFVLLLVLRFIELQGVDFFTGAAKGIMFCVIYLLGKKHGESEKC